MLSEAEVAIVNQSKTWIRGRRNTFRRSYRDADDLVPSIPYLTAALELVPSGRRADWDANMHTFFMLGGRFGPKKPVSQKPTKYDMAFFLLHDTFDSTWQDMPIDPEDGWCTC